MPHYMVEILHTIKLETHWICGAAPMDKLMVALTVPKYADPENDEENKPQLLGKKNKIGNDIDIDIDTGNKKIA